MPDTRRITARLPDDFLSYVEAEAEASGLSVSGLVREALIARVLLGRLIRGESLYTAAYDVAVALRGEHDPDAAHAAEHASLTAAILRYAPDELDHIIQRLEETAPDRAALLREMYGIPPRRFARESLFRHKRPR